MLRPDKEGRASARDEEQLRAWNRRIVELGERQEVAIRPYEKNLQKYMTVPEISRKLRLK